ncbi:YodC family protein [Enterobacter hormaechei]|nr:YodC family protein [Enterobacter hormaechei]
MTVKAGDVVTLKSGGPNMTVLGFAGDMGAEWADVSGNYIVVAWMDNLGHKLVDAFDPATLMFANTDPAIGCG